MLSQGLGSGSFEDAGPLQIVAMEKEAQIYVVHESRFRKRERFSYKTPRTLPQSIIPALDMCCFSCFFTVRLVSPKHAKA